MISNAPQREPALSSAAQTSSQPVSGQITLRRIDGWRKIAGVLSQWTAMAA